MGLILAPRHYEWPVHVPVPNPAIPGQFETRRLVARFQPLPNSEEEELLTGLARAGRQRDQRRERLRLTLKGLSGLTDRDGDDIPFDDDTLTLVLDDARLVAALDKAYMASVAGVEPGKPAAVKEGYVLDQSNSFKFPIEVELPDPARPGRTVTHRLMGTFRELGLSAAVNSRDLAADATLDVQGFQTPDGKPIAWDQAKSVALDDPAITNAILTAYQRGLDGVAVQARREKN